MLATIRAAYMTIATAWCHIVLISEQNRSSQRFGFQGLRVTKTNGYPNQISYWDVFCFGSDIDLQFIIEVRKVPPVSIVKLFNDVVEKSDILKFVSEGEAHERACRLAGSLSFEDADDDYEEPSRHIVIDDDGPARPLRRPRAEASWHLHGAMNVPGIKHAFSNLSGDILQRWKDFKMFQEALTAVNTLHHQTFYRDRLAEVIGEPLKKLFKYYEGGNLVLWRWSSLVQPKASSIEKIQSFD